MSKVVHAVVVAAIVLGSGLVAADGRSTATGSETTVVGTPLASTAPGDDIAESFDVGEGRTLYLQCSGEGSPLILLEAGDESGVEEWQPVSIPSRPRRARVPTTAPASGAAPTQPAAVVWTSCWVISRPCSRLPI